MQDAAMIYVGAPEALQAEVGIDPCYQAPFVVAAFLPCGALVTPELAKNKKEARGWVAEVKAWLIGEGYDVRICWL